MDTDTLTSISPIDGRYSDVTSPLRNFFSEHAYLKTGLKIETEYFIFLSKIKIFRSLTTREIKFLKNIYLNFSPQEAVRLKTAGARDGLRIHDLKSIEYYFKSALVKTSLSSLSQWIHFGLTSNDIVDNAYRTLILEALKKIIVPEVDDLQSSIDGLSKSYLKLPMLGRTHGQPAIPTTFGKEMAVFSTRIKKELKNLKNTQLYGKFGGAIGNWNALRLAFPAKDWPTLSGKFLKSLDLEHSKVTTQIAPTEDLIELFQNIYRINSILIDFNQDVWRYISDEWLIQKGKTGFVGSSTMPQKINPIEFENSEGNLIMANGLFEIFCRKLPISRLQRDLSDSTVLRNIGVAFAHCFVAYKSCQKGLESISPNKEKILEDLNADWSILGEALQTILRKEGKANAYESVASQIRGKKLNEDDWVKLIDSLNISKQNKTELRNLTPEKYTGFVNF